MIELGGNRSEAGAVDWGQDIFAAPYDRAVQCLETRRWDAGVVRTGSAGVEMELELGDEVVIVAWVFNLCPHSRRVGHRLVFDFEGDLHCVGGF